MKSLTRRSLSRSIVLALAVAALIGPTAQAKLPDPDEDGVGGQYGPPDAWQYNVIASQLRTRHASTPQKSVVATQIGSPDLQPTVPGAGQPATAPAASDDGFDYRDAAIGFGTAAGIALLSIVAGITIHRRGGRRLAST
jgi:hypothetical protein